jgi:hypothetical protein
MEEAWKNIRDDRMQFACFLKQSFFLADDWRAQ